MVQSHTNFDLVFYDRTKSMVSDDIHIEEITAQDSPAVVDMIRRNLAEYEEVGSVLAATWRRLDNINNYSSGEGNKLFVAKNVSKSVIVGCVGIGSLHGLPATEGIGEIRDLVVDTNYRGQGTGKRLLRRAIESAKKFGYQRLYLETTPQMENAKKLFIRFGFRAVVEAKDESKKSQAPKTLPSYFLLEDLGQNSDN